MRTLATPAAFLFVVLLAVIQACAPAQAPIRGNRIRSIPEMQATHHHRPVTLRVGWVPYTEWTESNADGTASVADSVRFSEMPVIFVAYPDSADGLWLDPSIDDALLGRLVKHSLMTQQPISRPFDEFLGRATCSPCHPERVPLAPR